jgi:hypothetical protein
MPEDGTEAEADYQAFRASVLGEGAAS